jgi:Type II secretion system (T2SS), protein K
MNRRRGVIFVTALGIIVVLTGLALVFAQAMRTEALVSANRRAQAQADATELGAEQWVLAQIDEYKTDAYTLTSLVQTDTLSVGSNETTGYFWILPADLSTVQGGSVCGIVDESSKLNINNAALMSGIGALQTLCDSLNLTIPDDTPYSISNWATNGSNSNGASSQDYSAFPEPYEMKGQAFESVEELLLVGQQADFQQNTMPQLLWGTDTARNTLLAEYNQNAGQPVGGMTNGATVNTPGIFNYLTVYSASFAASGRPAAGAAGNRIINPFTASLLVLEAIGFSDAQAQSIVEARESSYESDSGQLGAAGYNWAMQAAGGGSGLAATFLTGASNRYSADIGAVSADGRAFRRVRIVVDVSQSNPLGAAGGTTPPPAVIIYRKDLTAYGWPLPSRKGSDLRDQLRHGTQLQPGALGAILTGPGIGGQSQ